jgi:hypothetical protein
MLLQPFIEATSDFPPDVNVRIHIAGLAVCDRKGENWDINFLRNVPDHNLSIKIEKKRRNNPKAFETMGPYPINDNYRTMSIECDDSNPTTSAGPLPLSWILKFSELHLHPIKYKKDPLTDTKLTYLTIYDCQLYTEHITEIPFELFRIEPDGKEKPLNPRQIGDEIVAYMCCGDNSLTTITVERHPEFPIDLPQKDDEGEIVYDIYLNNACIDEVKCKHNSAASNETDFRFYYEVIKDKDNPGRRIKIKKSPPPQIKPEGTGVEACNPAIGDDGGDG